MKTSIKERLSIWQDYTLRIQRGIKNMRLLNYWAQICPEINCEPTLHFDMFLCKVETKLGG